MFRGDTLDDRPIYREIRELGEGTFGKVTLVKDETRERFLARKSVSDIVDILVGIRESDLLVNLGTSTPAIACLQDFRLYTEDDRYYAELYLDYCSGGSLETALDYESKNPDKPPTALLGGIGERLRKLGLVIHLLDFLQMRGVYHMDIKTENLLIHKDRLVLCDFSNYFRESPWKTMLEPPVVPQEATFYRPPEVAHGRVSRTSVPKADVWAMGVLILELMGCWETVDKMDFRVNERMQRMNTLVQRIKVCQTSFQKRCRQKSKAPKFEIASRLLFRNIYPSDFPETFGSDFENVSSPENEMVWCLMFAREIQNLDFEQLLGECLEYFRIRTHLPTEEERGRLETLFRVILPNMLKPRVSDRWDMQTASQFFSRELDIPDPFEKEVCGGVVSDLGLWERIPDPLWRATVLKFRDSVRGLKIRYGTTSIEYPVHHLVYAKHLAERAMEKMIMGGEGDQFYIPKTAEDRGAFYEKMLSVSVLLSSEILDFIFPHQRSEWFEGRELASLAPYLEMCCKLLIGEIAFTDPSREELEVLKGERNL